MRVSEGSDRARAWKWQRRPDMHCSLLPCLSFSCPHAYSIDCPAGTYVASAAQTSCISCLKGQYSASGAAQTAAAVCVNCSPGQYSTSGAGQASVTVCQACAGGKYSISGAAQTSPGVCISCAQGHYSPSKGQATANACIACIPGKYSSAGVGQANESSCSNCAAGKYSAAAAQTSSTSCKPCMKGTYGRPVGLAQITCISCPIGKYSALTGQVDASTCVGCGRGKYASSGTAQTSSAICIDCRAGQFSDVDIPTQCAKCAQGSYNNEAGKSKCKICNEGEGRTWTRLPGAVNSSSCVAMVGQKCPKHFQQEDPRLGICVCEAGAVRSTPNGACSPCPSGTFRPANSEDSLACQRCPPGSWSAEQASTCNICPSGTFNAKAGATSPSSCIPCTNSTRNGTCPAGSGAPLTDMAAQALEVARKISSAGKIDQTIDDTITAATAESSGGNGGGGGDGDGGDGGDSLADILNEHVMYISTSSMVTLALITIALHWLFPACFYSRVDVFHLDHVIDEGESPVRRRTQLGSAFTVAFLPVVVVAALVLIRANNNVVTEALSLPMDQVAAKTAMFRVRVTSPFAFGNVTAGGCDEGITLAPASIEGIRCESPTELSWSPKDCMLEGRRCTIGEDAKLGFKVSMDYKAVSFSAGSVTPRVEGGKPAGDGQLVVLNGTVASPSGDQVLAGSTVVRLQLLATYVQDNTSSAALFWQRDTESSNENIQTGYQLSPRPHVRALTVSSQQGVTATSSWDLEIQIQRLPTALKTVITRGQDTVQLLAAILTLAATLFAIWRRVFGEFEDFVKLCQRKISCCRPRSNKAKASGAIELVEDPQEATRNTCSNSSSSSSSSSNSIPERLQVVSGGSADSAGSKALTAGNERTSTNIGAEGPSYAASAGDWTKQQDPTSGQDYYFNERTRATTWTDPDSKQDVVNPMFQGVAPASDASNTPLELKKRLGRAEQEIKEMRAKIAQADERASKAEQRLAAIEAALRTDSQRQRKSD